MRILLFGASGFIGRTVRTNLEIDHEVIPVVRPHSGGQELEVDLLNLEAIEQLLDHTQPEVVINAAGIVDPKADPMLNIEFTKNILSAAANTHVNRIIIFGSAGEYGRIEANELPVDEETPLRADSGYGLSKKLEEQLALEYRERGFPVIVTRIFNPIGVGMAEKFFVSQIKKQIEEYLRGERTTLELSRKDSTRDYIAVDDIALAIRALIEGSPVHGVYNIGSGVAMSNGELLQLMVSSSKIEHSPEIVETSTEPEPLVASQADITRIQQEFHWEPKHSIAAIVEEIMND